MTVDKENSITYKKSYSIIFMIFYLVQGLHNGIWGTVLGFYLIINIRRFDEALLFLVTALTIVLWSLKFFIGMINDKYQISEKFGRRFPFICIFGTFGGIWWIIMGFYLPLEILLIYIFLMLYGLWIHFKNHHHKRTLLLWLEQHSQYTQLCLEEKRSVSNF